MTPHSSMDVFELGNELNDDGSLWEMCLYALDSYSSRGDLDSQACVNYVASHLIADTHDIEHDYTHPRLYAVDANTELYTQYVRQFLLYYGIDSTSDIEALLGIQATEKQDYLTRVRLMG